MFTDAEVLARISDFLFTHRIVRTKVPKGSRARDGEKEVTAMLQDMDGGQRAFLEDYFFFRGFTLRVFDWTEYPGIPHGGQFWCIVRNPSKPAPLWLSGSEVRERLALPGDPRLTTTIWSFVIYMHYLKLAYTKIDRHPSEISRFVDVVFTREELAEDVRSFIDSLAEEHAGRTEAVKILAAEKGQDVERRVNNFLAFLLETNAISFERADQAYSQTILGASEVAEHFDWEIFYLLPHDTLGPESIEQIMVSDDAPSVTEEDNVADQ